MAPVAPQEPGWAEKLKDIMELGVPALAAMEIAREDNKQEALKKLIAAGVPAVKAMEILGEENVGAIAEGVIPGAGTLTDISGFVSALTQRNTWLRIGQGVLGLLLIGIGVAALTRGTAVGGTVRKVAKATPVGKVGKALK